jgi:hypothetical protein
MRARDDRLQQGGQTPRMKREREGRRERGR